MFDHLNVFISLFLVSLISGVRVATRLCRQVDDPPPLSSILDHHPPVHVLQLRLSHFSLDAISPSHTWSSSLSLSPLLVNIMSSLVVDPLSFVLPTSSDSSPIFPSNTSVCQPPLSARPSSSGPLSSLQKSASPSCFHTPAVYVGVSRKM